MIGGYFLFFFLLFLVCLIIFLIFFRHPLFEEIPLNAYNCLPHHHSISDSNVIEETNIFTELISRIQLSTPIHSLD